MKSVTPSGSLGLEMRVGLWIIQVLLAVVFASTGAVQTLPPIEEVTRLLPQFVDYHPLLIRIIGISELLGAAGLILPGLTGIRPGLTTWAAGGLATIMVLAIGVHLLRADFMGAVLPLVLFGMASFVVYGRTRESSL